MKNEATSKNLNDLPPELQEQIARTVAEIDYTRGDEISGNRSIKSLKATNRQFRDVTRVTEVAKNKEDLKAIISSARDLHEQVMESHDVDTKAGKPDWHRMIRRVTPTLHLQDDQAKSTLENKIMRLDEVDRLIVAEGLVGHQDKLLPHGKKLVQAAYERLVKVRSHSDEENMTDADLQADSSASFIVGGGRRHLSKHQQEKIASLIESGDRRLDNFHYHNDKDATERAHPVVKAQKERIRDSSSVKVSIGLTNLASLDEGSMKDGLYRSFGDVASEKVEALRNRQPKLLASSKDIDRQARQELAGVMRERSERGR